MPTSQSKTPSDTARPARPARSGAKRGPRTSRSSRSRPAARAATARTSKRTNAPKRYWSQHVTETSDALDLDEGVFSLANPRAIAASLKRSADRSRRRKSDPYRSAMSMLVFYVNRAGRNLSASRKEVLEKAKGELRALYGRSGGGRGSERRSATAQAGSRATTRAGSRRARAKGGRTGRA